jgi:hypothetical protein
VSVTLDATLGTGKAHLSPSVDLVLANPVAAGGLIILTTMRFGVAGTLTVTTTGGLTWTAVSTQVVSGSLAGRQFWAVAPSGLSAGTTLTAGASGSNDNMICGISLLGADSVSPVAAFNSRAASAVAWDGGALGAGGDAAVAVAFEDGNATATSAATTGTEFADFNDATQTEAMTGVYTTGLGGAGVTPGGNWSVSSSVLGLAVSIAAATGGAVATPAFAPHRMPLGI